MARRRRMQGCQSTNHTECYGVLWRCQRCGKTVCCAEGTTDDPDLCDDCWVEVHVERSTPCPKMQLLIGRLAFKYQFNFSRTGDCLLLALPASAERLLIAGLSGKRIGLTHCLADEGAYLACDADMVFLIVGDEFQPVELLHTDAVWEEYVQAMVATGAEPVQGGEENFDMADFAEYWAELLIQQHWFEESQRCSI